MLKGQQEVDWATLDPPPKKVKEDKYLRLFKSNSIRLFCYVEHYTNQARLANILPSD